MLYPFEFDSRQLRRKRERKKKRERKRESEKWGDKREEGPTHRYPDARGWGQEYYLRLLHYFFCRNSWDEKKKYKNLEKNGV